MFEDKQKEKIDIKLYFKRLLIVILVIVFTVSVVFMVVFWQLNKVIDKQGEQISSLEKQIELLSEKIKSFPDE